MCSVPMHPLKLSRTPVLIAALTLGAVVNTAPAGASSARTEALPAPVPCDTSLGDCWRPSPGTDWQWQLQCDTPNTCTNLAVRVPFYDIDWEDNPASTVQAIHNAGGHAYCYVDIGTWEDWRSDADQFPASVKGRQNGWPGERWLDIRRLDILGPIMAARMDVCAGKGFDGVQFDNVDGWQTNTGFPLTQDQYVYYTAWMANAAHAKGLSAAWENAIENAPALQPYMDALMLEQCFQYGECGNATAMSGAGKWIGGVEYKKGYRDLRFCPTYDTNGVAGMFKKMSLQSFRKPCP